jgi:hypothetical protein
MKIIEIERTVSNHDYSNLKMKAILAEGEDPIKASIELDATIRKSLNGIVDSLNDNARQEEEKRQKLNKLEILRQRIANNEDCDLPF